MLRFLPSHLTYAEIARKCFMSVNTVKTHLKRIYAKLEVSSRAYALVRTRELSLLSAGDASYPRFTSVEQPAGGDRSPA